MQSYCILHTCKISTVFGCAFLQGGPAHYNNVIAMTHQLVHSFVVEARISEVWKFLWNVDAVARCIPGCEDVSVIEHNKYYAARIKKKMGPFAVAINLDVEVIEARPPDFLSVSVKGNDRRLRSEVTQLITLQLTPIGESTQLDIEGEFSLTGLLGSLNKNLIVGQVSQIMDEFSGTLRKAILAS
jgi:uncharacterized protein